MSEQGSGRGRGAAARRWSAGVAAAAVVGASLTLAAGPAQALAPTTTVASAAFSADSGASGSDFITNVAPQTISGTLSAPLANGEAVQVSIDGGGSWTTATAAGSSWSLGVTLSVSNTLQVKVVGADGDGAVYAQAYAYDTTAPATTFSGVTLSADTGSYGDYITATASQTITAQLSASLSAGDVLEGSLDGATWTDLTSRVSGTTLTWTGATLSGSSSVRLRLTDIAGNEGTTFTQSYVLDTTAPTLSISSDRARLRAGETATITFTFSEDPGASFSEYDVVVSGGTLSALTGSGTTRTAVFTPSANSTSDQVQISVAGGSYADAAGNAGQAGLSPLLSFDTAPPGLGSVAVPADGTYYPGQHLDFTVNLSEPVTVDTTNGTPGLGLTIGGTAVHAAYVSGTGSSALSFRYTIEPGLIDADGITVGALSLNGGTVRDLAGNDAVLTLNSVPSTAGVLVGPATTQVLEFDPASPTDAVVGGPGWTPTARVIGAGSGSPVTYSVDPATGGFGSSSQACSLSAGTVRFDHAGNCVIAADKAGDGGAWGDAATVRHTVAVAPVPVVVVPAPPTPVAPTVTPTVHTPEPATNGWYPGPVRITFACTAGSAPLSAACPAPVTLGDGLNQYVTHTVLAADGGTTTVTYGPYDIDATAPALRLVGVPTSRGLLTGRPQVSCAATDATSGIADCRVQVTTAPGSVTYVATAHDRAGNATVVRRVVELPRKGYAIAGAASHDGTLTLQRGETYTLVVVGTQRPRFAGAHAPVGRFRHAGSVAGVRRWTVDLTVGRHVRRGAAWDLTVRTGTHTQVIHTRIG